LVLGIHFAAEKGRKWEGKEMRGTGMDGRREVGTGLPIG